MENHHTKDPIYTFDASVDDDDDGIPTLNDDSLNPSPVIEKATIFEEKTRTRIATDFSKEDAKAVFTIDGEGFDVILSENKGKIYFSPMSVSGRRKSARKLSGLLRSRRPSMTESSSDDGIALSSLFGVHVKRRPTTSTSRSDTGLCQGLVLSMLERKNENVLREKTLFMEHPSTFKRPRAVKLFLQPYAGAKNGRSLYQKNVLPLFQHAGITVDMSEIVHNEYVKQAMTHLDFEEYDCIACMGGDGTVNQVLDALMSRSQKEKGVDLKVGNSAAASPVPLGIIPIGRTNHVAFSLMGANDIMTGVLHIMYGHFQPVDVCSIITPEKICRWGFNSQYGFAGQVLTYLHRYKALGSKRVDAATIKALTKAKLRSYECEIEYIPADNQRKGDQTPCTTGCGICMGASKNDNITDCITDMVQELDPLNQSFTSNTSSVIDLPQDTPWRTVKGKYMNVGLFTIPGRSEMSPQGLCKYTHLSDGTLDLVLVKETEKKEFVRHLKRHGNSKNQNDFPFIEVIKVKEVRFRPRYPTGWNYNDHDFSEIKYQMEREGSKAQNQESMEVINDLDRANSISTLDISDDDDENSDDEQKEPKPQMLGPQYRKTFTEIEVERRRKIARKKEEKMKAREESKMLSVWNIDNQQVKSLELDFKVHHGVLAICACGVSPLSEYEDVRTSWLS
ncbi:ceramide kinase-like protein [Plakobranchus ocellatus]|uniref:Ceramide kinase-like protein n=1 Tax=Plakobranchus ocellatus TaxID=259542 RepID=A0AAV4DDA5_9GAST|nr:ceramide kinase-like protein [Plakobranchus ocellatus]